MISDSRAGRDRMSGGLSHTVTGPPRLMIVLQGQTTTSMSCRRQLALALATRMGLDDPTAGADANEDGSVNTLDITRIELIIMGG